MRHDRLSGPVAAAALTLLLSTAASAQWLNYPTPGIPRLPDGKPNLFGPAPRTIDGKPDMSGVWGPPALSTALTSLRISIPRTFSPGPKSVPEARTGFPEGQSSRAMPPRQRPLPQFLQLDQDCPNPGVNGDPV